MIRIANNIGEYVVSPIKLNSNRKVVGVSLEKLGVDLNNGKNTDNFSKIAKDNSPVEPFEKIFKEKLKKY